MTGTLDQGETIVLTQENGQWKSPAGTVNEAAAKSLAATLDDETDLSAGEAALLRELLLRLATPPANAPR